MTDSSEDEYEDAETELPSSLERRLDRVEEQMSTIVDKLEGVMKTVENLSAMMQQPSESRRPMRACHARKSRPPQTTTDHAASKAGRKPIPDSETESEAVDRDDTTASTTPLLSGVMKNFPTIPLTDPKSRRGKPHVPPIPVYGWVMWTIG